MQNKLMKSYYTHKTILTEKIASKVLCLFVIGDVLVIISVVVAGVVNDIAIHPNGYTHDYSQTSIC